MALDIVSGIHESSSDVANAIRASEGGHFEQGPTGQLPVKSTTTLDSSLEADPGFLDRTILEVLETVTEQKKQEDLASAGLSATFASDLDGPWEMLQARVARYVAGGVTGNELPQAGDKFSPSVQIVTVPMAASWDDPKYGPYRLCKILGDSMPKWQPTYVPAARSLGDNFGAFIASLSIPAPTMAQQKEIDDARIVWQVQLDKVRSREAKVGANWLEYDKRQTGIPPSRRKTYDQYYEQYELPVISQMRRSLLGYQQIFTKKINDYTRGYGQVADMIARYSSASAMFQTPGEGTGDDLPQSVYRYAVDQSLADFKHRAARQPSDAVNWEFTSASYRLDSSSSYWGGSGSYGFFCRGSAGGSSSHIDWHSSDFKLVMKAKAIEKFTLMPDGWFSGDLIKLFKDGPFVKGSVADVAYKAGNLWHRNGMLSLRTASLVLIYEPSIELTISKQDYERNTSEWHASGGFSVGCFSFGANAGGSHEDVKYDAASSTIRATDTTGMPKILAVSTDVFPEFS